MQLTDLIQFYFDRSNALQNYWTLYVVVIGGILAFSTFRQRTSWVTTLVVTILYCSFAYKNLGAIEDASAQRLSILDSIRNAPGRDADAAVVNLLPNLEAQANTAVRPFHLFCDALTVAALWVFEIRRRRYQREDAAARPAAQM
ncbi:MAG TPA: hypothetical protein VF624_14070 [Tepidisphaeraceae bacterium]|jgi:hypothetical protein